MLASLRPRARFGRAYLRARLDPSGSSLAFVLCELFASDACFCQSSSASEVLAGLFDGENRPPLWCVNRTVTLAVRHPPLRLVENSKLAKHSIVEIRSYLTSVAAYILQVSAPTYRLLHLSENCLLEMHVSTPFAYFSLLSNSRRRGKTRRQHLNVPKPCLFLANPLCRECYYTHKAA